MRIDLSFLSNITLDDLANLADIGSFLYPILVALVAFIVEKLFKRKSEPSAATDDSPNWIEF